MEHVERGIVCAKVNGSVSSWKVFFLPRKKWVEMCVIRKR